MRSGELSGVRVLIVDDDEQMRTLLASVLARVGATVHTAASAALAFKALAVFEPHLLVSDIEMPVEDGYSLMRRIRAQRIRGSIPSIAVSGLSSDAAAKQALAAGFLVHMRKPVVVHELVRTVAALTSAERIT